MIALRLVHAHSGLFAALAATALVAGGLAVGVPGYLVGATTSATRTGVAQLTGADGGYRVGIRLSDDGSAQDSAVRRTIARATGGAPLDITRTLATGEPLEVRIGSTTADAYLRSDPDLRSHARLIDGSWSSDADAVAVQADAAERLGLSVGSSLTVPDDSGDDTSADASTDTSSDTDTTADTSGAPAAGGTRLRVAALWRATAPQDPRWLGDRSVRTGRGDGGDGPVIVDPAVWGRIGVTPLAQWTMVPDAQGTDPGDLDALGRIDSSVPDALRATSVGDSGVSASGRLPDGIRAIALRVTAVLATAPVSIIVLIALALLALVELARLLLFSRAREMLLLRSRGASTLRLAGTGAAEAGAVALISAAIGGIAAALAVTATTSVAVSPGLVAASAAGIAIVAAVVFGGTTWRAARAALTREQVADSGRGRQLASVGVVVLVVAAAGLSSVQFLRDGSPLVARAGRAAQIDPLAAPAPALAIVAVALLAVALAPLAARAGTGILDRGPRLGTLLARRLRRGLASIATGVVLVALAAALLVTAASYSATLDRASRDNRALRLGADVSASDTTVDRLRGAADRLGAPSTLASVSDAVLGDRDVALVAIPREAIRTVVTDGGGSLDASALSRALTAPAPGVPLPRDAGTARFTVSSSEVAPERMVLRMLTADGVLLSASGTPSASGQVGIRIPGDASRLIGIDAVLPPAGPLDPFSPPLIAAFAVSDLRTDRGALRTGDAWIAPFVAPDSGVPTTSYRELGATVAVNPGVRTTVRLMPATSARVPVVLSSDLAAASGLRVGSSAALDDSGATVRIEVRAVVAAVPGAGGDGILADLPSLRDAQLRGTDLTTTPVSGDSGATDLGDARLWVRGTEADAARLRAELPRTAIVDAVSDTSAAGAVSSAAAGLWLGTAGALLLAAIAVAAVVGADLRARDGDIAVLRALGVDPRRQGRDRAVEHAAVLGYGLVAGALGGLAVSALLVPGLVRAAVADPVTGLPIGLRVDPLQLGAGIVALIVVLGALTAVTAARIRARARVAVVAEAVR